MTFLGTLGINIKSVLTSDASPVPAPVDPPAANSNENDIADNSPIPDVNDSPIPEDVIMPDAKISNKRSRNTNEDVESAKKKAQPVKKKAVPKSVAHPGFFSLESAEEESLVVGPIYGPVMVEDDDDPDM